MKYFICNCEIGDRLALQVGERFSEGRDKPLNQSEALRVENDNVTETLKNVTTREYTIVGIIKRPAWEPTWAPGYTAISYVDENLLGANDRVNAAVVLQKVNHSLFAHAENLAKNNNIESVQYNHELLHYYGVAKSEAAQNTLFSLSAIIMAVIMIGSVSLIYNAFAISVSERSRHLGILASVGATKRQKRNSVFFEGVIIGLISIPTGMICGLVGIGMTLWFINSIMGMITEGLGGLNIIVSERVMDQLMNDKGKDEGHTCLYLKSPDPMKTQQQIEDMKETNLDIHNTYQYRKQNEQKILLMSVFSYGFIALISLISIANIFNTISTGISLRKREFAMLKSVGITPKGFNKMMNYESIFYGIKSLCYGLPSSFAVMYLIYRAMTSKFNYGFVFPWMSVMYVIAAVFVIVSSAMLYSSAKVKKENIIDAIKQESI